MILALGLLLSAPDPAGPWRAALDLAGGELRFSLTVSGDPGRWTGRLCNGPDCRSFSRISQVGGSLGFEMADYAATISAVATPDSLVGFYHNVGQKGPRTIPFRASRGNWPAVQGPGQLMGDWDAWFQGTVAATPRILRFKNGSRGLEGT